MKICHDHNLRASVSEEPHPYGIRLTLPEQDPLRRVLGDDWEKTHWYATETERDAALKELSKQHAFSRIGDRPTLAIEKIAAE